MIQISYSIQLLKAEGRLSSKEIKRVYNLTNYLYYKYLKVKVPQKNIRYLNEYNNNQTAKLEKAIVILYQSKELTVVEIMEYFNVDTIKLYKILRASGLRPS